MMVKKCASLLLLAFFSIKAMDSSQIAFISACLHEEQEDKLQKLYDAIPEKERAKAANEALISVCVSSAIPEDKTLEILEFLFAHGATAWYKNCWDLTPLTIAIAIGQPKTIIERLKENAKKGTKEPATANMKSSMTGY